MVKEMNLNNTLTFIDAIFQTQPRKNVIGSSIVCLGISIAIVGIVVVATPIKVNMI